VRFSQKYRHFENQTKQMYKISTKVLCGPPRHIVRKWLMRIKLVAVLLLATIMQVSASALGQNVTLHQNKITLSRVFKEIGKQTGYHVLWEPDKLNSGITVNARFSGASLKEVMESCLKGTAMDFVIEDKTIVVAEKKTSVFDLLANIFKNIDLRGKVVDEKGNPLVGASIKLKDFNRITTTNQFGVFEIKNVDEDALVTISYLGYTPKTIVAKAINEKPVVLVINSGSLQEVAVVSDGYQKISRERATGSYEFLDSTIINRGVSPNIIDRIENMAPGILTLRNRSSATANEASFSIRGRSTIYSAVEPLVVVDNYPFEGDINSINPNDVESITILKDAAATSIWGARGGNGVLVITMKKGKLNQPAQVSFNTSFTMAGKADLYSVPQLSSSEFIDVQTFLYGKGYYGYAVPNPGDVVSPLVRILNEQRNNVISAVEAERRIAQLRTIDIRDDLTRYTQDNIFNQQYNLSVRGGGVQNKYYMSGSFDKGHSADKSNSNRKSFMLSEKFNFFNNKLQIGADIVFSDTQREGTNFSLPSGTIFPYTKLADDQGNPLEVPYKYSKTQIAGLAGGKLIDMTYVPLDEYNYGRNVNHIQDYSIKADVSYSFTPTLQFSASYQYGNGISDFNGIYDVESFQVREMINTFTTYNAATGAIVQNYPYGGNNLFTRSKYNNNNVRTQLVYNETLGADHQISALAGAEVRNTNNVGSTRQELGYNKEFDTYQRVNQNMIYQSIFNGGNISIPIQFRNSNTTNRFVSLFVNASYTYKNKYILSASARKDESNLFGVASNQKGVPLWSAGLAWLINSESFYHIDWLPLLKLRLTNGYSGNTNPNTSAKTIATLGAGNNAGLGQFYQINNPPNTDLRWEKVQQMNLGIDFGFKNNLITGSVEFFRKNARDLISSQSVAPQVGVLNFTGNFGDVRTTGFDLSLNSKQVSGKDFSWGTNLIVSSAVDVITKLDVKQNPRNSVLNNSAIPRLGYAYSALFTYRYAGLNALGQPMVYFNGMPTTDLASVINTGNEQDIVYIGNNNPKVAGSIRNDFTYKNLSLSFLISYRLGHYFKRQAMNYSSLFFGNYFFPDFANRWQKPGDELFTDVPVMSYPANNIAQLSYDSSDAMVEKGDSFRLQDIQFSYSINKVNFKRMPFKSLQVYAYANNMGLLWKSTKYAIDPDFPTSSRSPKQYSLGLRATL
jgi:TonB-linked SusC/RagA family outer membrane protein